MISKRLCVFVIALLAPVTCLAQGWWMTEPVRLVQVNLPGHMAPAMDPEHLMQQLEEMSASTLMINMGGIVANYPTDLPYHIRNEHLPPGRDYFGEVLEAAHARGLRVIGRFDFSRAQRAVFEAHPEWFFLKADGSYVVDENGIYATCINAGYYREYAFRILEEALTRYPVDGLFFNMFGDAPVNYYTGEVMGTCRAPDNVARFEASYGKPIPDDYEDPDYRRFMRQSSKEVADSIGALIHRIRPEAGFMTYLREEVDVIMDETAMARSAVPPLWPYFASVNVDRARSTWPDKMIFNLMINFESFRHRFASVPEAFTAASLYQNMAHGAAPAFTVLGTFDQPDPRGLEAAREVFRRHAAAEDLYVGQQNAARVVLAGRYHREPAFRGIVHMLNELHVPFTIKDDLSFLSQPDRYDLVITTGGVPSEFEEYLRMGGRLLATGSTPPALKDLPTVVRKWGDTETMGSYFRVRHSENLSSLRSIDLLPLEGPYLEFSVESPLTLVPPATFSPPDVVAVDQRETDRPGLLLKDYGAGRLAYVPWEIGALYYEKGSPSYRALVSDLVDVLLPNGRQLETNAHPLVEITVMEQEDRTLVHLINLSGYTGSTFHEPVPMGDISISIRGRYASARIGGTGEELRVEHNNGYTRVVVRHLEDYAVVVLGR